MRREYIPLSMDKLQLMIDLDRLDTSKPIDLVQLCNSGFFDLKPDTRQYGFALTDDGIEKFKGKINIEVQHASELIISTIERNGGVIRTAYFDVQALMAMRNPKKFFATGVPIPRYVCLVYLFKYIFFGSIASILMHFVLKNLLDVWFRHKMLSITTQIRKIEDI